MHASPNPLCHKCWGGSWSPLSPVSAAHVNLFSRFAVVELVGNLIHKTKQRNNNSRNLVENAMNLGPVKPQQRKNCG